MPTPSPNQPPNPPSPPANSSSTCPDDVQTASRPSRRRIQSHTNHDVNMSLRTSNETDQHAPTDAASPRGGLLDEAGSVRTDRLLLVDEQTSIEPSSRGTTMSPAPRSIATARTSPVPPSIEDEAPKQLHVDAPLSSMSREQSASLCQRNATPDATRHTSMGSANHCRPGNSDELRIEDSMPSSPMGSGYSSSRVIPISPSSFLRPGSKFHGTQQSERQVYDVQVEIKHVDMRESFLCGYLRIQGLTADHPTLTTYFEGEIIGDQYGFITKHDDWGANVKVDLSHWAKFNAFRPYQKHARRGPVNISDAAQRENIFMRWKEHFLVPDHRVRTISGASFEGFYYICFNQVKGEVSGIYFHSKSEK
ncbi:vacuolar import and degradation protein [Sarocladium implicatum]|nr:vacuolar import and degradation protein [Sarocladium implicatum]